MSYIKLHMTHINIKLIFSWDDRGEMREIWNRMCPKGDYRWNNLYMLPEDSKDEADYYVIVGHPRPGAHYIPHKTIIIQMEPTPHLDPAWIDLDPGGWFYVFDTRNHRNSIEWHLGWTYSQLMSTPVTKSKILSSVTSAKQYLEGHRKRYTFLGLLDANFSDIFDLYGRDKIDVGTYRGELPRCAKEDGLMPYKYTFAAENYWQSGYFTEKIVDAILSECLCFYWGCPNLPTWIDPRAFIRIDLDQPEEGIQIIRESIRTHEWEARIEIIRAEKRKILNHLQIFPTLERIITERREGFTKIRLVFDHMYYMGDDMKSRMIWKDVYGLDFEIFPGNIEDLYRKILETGHEWSLIMNTNSPQIRPSFTDVFGSYWKALPPYTDMVLFGTSRTGLTLTPINEYVDSVRNLDVDGVIRTCYAVNRSCVQRLLSKSTCIYNVCTFRSPHDDASSCGLIVPIDETRGLYDQLRHYRHTGQHARAYDVFRKLEAMSIPDGYTRDLGIWDELGIIAYYVNKPEEGIRAFTEILQRNRGKDDRVGLIRQDWDRLISNLRFYKDEALYEKFKEAFL